MLILEILLKYWNAARNLVNLIDIQVNTARD